MNHDLTGIRVWLSGSLPDHDDAARARVTAVVREVADGLFRAGATLIHGSHPSLVPILLKTAKASHKRARRKAGLTLAASEYHVKEFDLPIGKWRETLLVLMYWGRARAVTCCRIRPEDLNPIQGTKSQTVL